MRLLKLENRIFINFDIITRIELKDIDKSPAVYFYSTDNNYLGAKYFDNNTKRIDFLHENFDIPLSDLLPDTVTIANNFMEGKKNE